MFASTSCQKRGRRRMIAWAASWTAMSIVHAAFAGRNVQVDRVSRGTATFSMSGSLTTITASNRAIINYTQFDIANGETVQFVQPSSRSKVLNRITSNAPSLLDGTLLANGIVYFVNPAGVMFGPHSIVNASGIIAAAGNITDNDFAAGIDHFSGSAALVNSGTINAGSAQFVGQTVTNHGTINSPAGLVEMVAGQDVMLGSTSSNILVKIGTTTSHGGLSNDGTINAAGGSASLVSGDLYSMALGTPSVIKANQVSIQGGNVSVSGKIDASNSTPGATGGSVTVTGQTIAVSSATIDASGAAGGGTIKVGGDFHAAADLPLAQTTSVSADSTLTADATVNGNGGQVAVWSSEQTNFAGQISARGVGAGTGGFAEISSKGTLLYPGSVYVGGPGGAGTVLLDPATFVIAPTGGDATGEQIAIDVISSAGNYDVTATSEIEVHDTVDISGTTNTLTLDAPTIDFTKPVIINAGTPNLLGGADVAVVNIHNGALIQNGIDVFSSMALTAPYPVVNIDAGTYAEAVNVRQGDESNPITFIAGGAVSVTSLTVGFLHTAYFEGSFTASGGFIFNDQVHAGLPSPSLGAAEDLTLTGPITINNDGGTNSEGSIDTNNQNVTLITDSLSISPLAQIDNFSGTSGQGLLTIQPATPSDTIGIGDTTPPAAMIRIDPIDNIGGDLRMVVIGSPTGSGAITVGTSTFFTPVTIESPATGGTIAVNGQFNGTFFNVGALTLNAPATAGSIAITAPIVMSAAGVTVDINGGTTLSANITTERSTITINGDVVLGGSATIDATSGHTTGLDANGADISITSVSNGNGHNLILDSGTTGTISVTGNIDDVANLTVTQSDGVTFGGTLGAGTAGNVTISASQNGSEITFDGAANILTFTTSGSSPTYSVFFNNDSGGQTSTIQTASIANTSGLVLGNNTGDSITFTHGLNYQVGTAEVIGSVSVGASANIDLGVTILTGNTTFSAATTTFHGALSGPEALTVDGNAVFDSSIPIFTSLHVTGSTDFTVMTISSTGSQEYDGDVTLLGSGGSDVFNASNLTISGTLSAGSHNVTINCDATLGAVTAVNQLQVNGNAAFTDTVSTASVTVTGTTSIGSGAIHTTGAQDYQGAVTLDAGGQFISSSGGDITFASTIDSFSSGSPNSLFVQTAGTTIFDGNIGSAHPISSLQTAPFGTVQLGAGGANSTLSITASTASSSNRILFNFPVTLAANTTITAGAVIFSNSLDSDSDVTPRNLTITALAGTLDFAGPFTAESLTAAAADVSFASVGQTHSLGTVIINAIGSSAGAAVDLNNSPLNVSSATFSSPVILTADLTINASGGVDFESTIDSDSDATERSLTINTPGTTTFGGDVGDTHPLSSLTSSSNGTTVIDAASISVAGSQTYNNPVTLSADTTLSAGSVSFAGTVGGAHALTVAGDASFTGAVNIGSLHVTGGLSFTGADSITTTGSQQYDGQANLPAAAETFTGNTITFGGLLEGDGNDVTFNGNATFNHFITTGNVQINGNATFNGNVDVVSITVTGSTIADTADISTAGDQNYQGPVTLAGDTQFSSYDNGNLTFFSTVDSDGTPRSLTVSTSGATIFEGDLGDTHPLANLTVDSNGTTQLGAGGANSTIAITTVTTSPNGVVTFNNPTTLAGNTTITAQSVTFADTLDSDADASLRNLTITAASGMLDFTGPFTSESLTAGAAAVSFAATGQTHSLGNVIINASGPSSGAAIDLNNSPLDISSATFSSPVILTTDLTINATGDVDFQSTIDSDSNATVRSLTINSPGTTTFGGDIGDTHPLSGLSSSGSGPTDINAAAITVVGLQAYAGPVSLGANATLEAASVTFSSTIAGSSHNLAVGGNARFDAAVTGIGTLGVSGTAAVSADITSSGQQTYAGAMTLGSDVTLTGNGLSLASITGNSHNLTLNSGGGTIAVAGNTSGVSSLTIVNSGGATFGGTVTADAVTISDTHTGDAIVFDNAATIGTFTAQPGTGAYHVSFNAGTGGQTSIINTGTFDNTGTLILGNDPADVITFTSGLAHTTGPTNIFGTLNVNNHPLTLAATNIDSTMTLDAGSAAITLGNTTIAAGDTLTLGSGNSGSITVGSLSGVSGSNLSDVMINTTGAVMVTGAVGPNIDTLAITQSGGAAFGGAVSVNTLTLTTTTGTIAFNNVLSANILNDAGGGFDLQFLGATTTITNATTLGTTGTVTFGGGGSLTFTGGITHAAGPNIIDGDITTTDAPIDLNSATSVTGNSTLAATTGDITLGATTIANNVTLTLGSSPPVATPAIAAFVSNLTTTQSGDITVASVAGGSSSNIVFITTGNVSVPGIVGSSASPIGNLAVSNSRTATFGSAINASGDIQIAANDTENDAGSGDIVLGDNLAAGGDIVIQPGTDLTAIANIANAYAPSTITFSGNSMTAGGTISLAANDEIAAPATVGTIPSVANIIALGSPTSVNGFTGIALNIQAAKLIMGSDSNLSVPIGGVVISLSNGASTLSSITALGSIDISAGSQATVGVVDRGSWSVLTSTGELVQEYGTVFFAGGVGQPNILSTPGSLPTGKTLSKFASSFATANAKAGHAKVLKSEQLLTASDLQYPAGAAQYYLLAAVPAHQPPVLPTVVAVGALNINQQYIQENILFDSSMRKQFYRFGLYGRDITLDTVDGGVTGAGEPSDAGTLDITPMQTPTTQP
jgi:filamentous hemagglutinin family protein